MMVSVQRLDTQAREGGRSEVLCPLAPSCVAFNGGLLMNTCTSSKGRPMSQFLARHRESSIQH